MSEWPSQPFDVSRENPPDENVTPWNPDERGTFTSRAIRPEVMQPWQDTQRPPFGYDADG